MPELVWPATSNPQLSPIKPTSFLPATKLKYCIIPLPKLTHFLKNPGIISRTFMEACNCADHPFSL